MNNRRFIVCGSDRDYIGALTDYIRRNESGYEVVMYTDPEVFVKDNTDKEISLLMMDEEFMDKVCHLSEESDKEKTE